jgi:hypothetical protein
MDVVYSYCAKTELHVFRSETLNGGYVWRLYTRETLERASLDIIQLGT